ncbi:bifunctional UDP-N-acetylglucosamine diphosphorylase/glucosamine-1-phosphate N-acetyltransferase GlmU [Kitasatospora sp. NBC_01287]|uniref:bifunctional UDP-N-acetylglucosamine diphosphorylase/glucosamine-1-phosphate N-acetyltransferase GlmU n=1 Tax=Kitasatospora sp. NBC_01287 TaxID=2903573 RepID=UPI00224E5924|nr:bifunctional UDP-N-acetylglucosamine diphosphorylase/glucosamine-1-phosphate N-acetyltransferase GlmU [Kitasatospora sp. NBC_01287]MCX4747116.1 bifunctional UDP-N-acetylglucosamine diphosphorylase/glucosamine-1-phosphate N-acetyltransferase GlmU [Kitasatospora sp. NBC_01287]
MSANPLAAVIVLAAGEGTRMKSKALPKVLHPICGRSLLGHAVTAAEELTPQHLVVVIGHLKDLVAEHLGEAHPRARAVVQEKQHGTGHAARIAVEALAADGIALDGTVVVTYGDVPLLSAATLRELAERHAAEGNGVTVLTAEVPDPTGYGRIVRDGVGGPITGIVEHKDADAAQRAITEINSGVYAFDGKLLADALARIGTDNAQGEEYLTDTLEILRSAGHRVGTLVAADHREILGINDRLQLAEARRLLNDRLLEAAMRAGVTVVDPASTWIDVEVGFEPDAVVLPGTQLHGATHLGEGSRVGPNCTLTDAVVGAGATVSNAVVEQAEIGAGASVGPFAYLRGGVVLGAKGKVGTFVEVKKSSIGAGAKVPHLSYMGDATIGEGANVGAACVTANWDGVNKNPTVIGAHARVGTDNMLIAPVTVGDGAYTGAGSVISKDVPPGALGVNRAQQRNIEGWVARKRPGTASAAAAEAALAEAAPAGTDEA